MASKFANNFLEDLLKGAHNFSSDTFKIILMQSGFTFNEDTHAAYSDVSANELANAYGYTTGGATLSGASVIQDDVENSGEVSFNNASWNVSGGDLTASGAIIYNDTHASDNLVGYIDFGGDQTTLDGGVATIANILLKLLG